MHFHEGECPNCGRPNYVETTSVEHCPDCGLLCDYWGKGANQVYQDMMDRKFEEQREKDREEEEKLREIWRRQAEESGRR